MNIHRRIVAQVAGEVTQEDGKDVLAPVNKIVLQEQAWHILIYM